MATTTKRVQAAILKQTGVNVSLEKIEGTYYWCRPLDLPITEPHPVERFDESCTYYHSLSNISTQQAVDNFKGKYAT